MNTAIAKNTSSTELAAAIDQMQFDIWVGEEGYNTLPRLNGFPLAGVAHSVGHADNRLRHLDVECPSWGSEFIHRQLDEAAATAEGTGTECLLTIREWHGCHCGDQHRWTTDGGGEWRYSYRSEGE